MLGEFSNPELLKIKVH